MKSKFLLKKAAQTEGRKLRKACECEMFFTEKLTDNLYGVALNMGDKRARNLKTILYTKL